MLSKCSPVFGLAKKFAHIETQVLIELSNCNSTH